MCSLSADIPEVGAHARMFVPGRAARRACASSRLVWPTARRYVAHVGRWKSRHHASGVDREASDLSLGPVVSKATGPLAEQLASTANWLLAASPWALDTLLYDVAL